MLTATDAAFAAKEHIKDLNSSVYDEYRVTDKGILRRKKKDDFFI